MYPSYDNRKISFGATIHCVWHNLQGNADIDPTSCLQSYLTCHWPALSHMMLQHPFSVLQQTWAWDWLGSWSHHCCHTCGSPQGHIAEWNCEVLQAQEEWGPEFACHTMEEAGGFESTAWGSQRSAQSHCELTHDADWTTPGGCMDLEECQWETFEKRHTTYTSLAQSHSDKWYCTLQ